MKVSRLKRQHTIKFHLYDFIEKTKPRIQKSSQWLLWARGGERELLTKGQEGTFGDDKHLISLSCRQLRGYTCLSKFIELYTKKNLTEYKLHLDKLHLKKISQLKINMMSFFIFIFSKQLVAIAI